MRLSFLGRELVLVFCLLTALEAAVPPGEQSAQRLQKIHAVCESIFDKFSEKATEADLLVEVRSQLKGKLLPSQSGKLLKDEDGLRMTKDVLRQRAAEKFPIPEPEKLQQLAEEAFPLYQRGDRVRIMHKINPVATKITEGVLYEAKNGVIKVGNRVIRVRDMLGIDGNEAEALKFDEKATEHRRELFKAELVATQTEARQTWVQEHQEVVEQEVFQLCGRRNEENGYTCLDEEWLGEDELFVRVAAQAFTRLSLKRKLAKERELALVENSLEAQLQTVNLTNRVAPAGGWITPASELKRRAQVEQERQAALAAAREAALKREAEEKARLEEEKAAKLRAEQEEAARKRAELEAQMAEVSYSSKREVPLWVIAAVVLVIVGGVVGIVIWRRKANAEPDFKKFFEGKGKLQKEFWARVDADPDHFKYVAYLFPNMSEANNALSKLSYILTDRDGNLSCKKKIYFGAYPHQEGAVCFVGGEKLNYALWREASAVLPELPGAQYFKVSTEPDVLLALPDVDALNREGDLQMESLGVEDISNEAGEFSRCFRYSTISKENALTFLEKTDVQEEGVVIHVETPEGVFGKDINGIFEI
jgi:hypothetical protein